MKFSDVNSRTSIKDKIEPSIDYYLNAQFIIQKQVKSISKYQLAFTAIAIISLVLIFFFNCTNPYLVLFKNLVLTFLFIYSFLYVIFIKMIEKKQLKSTLDNIGIVVNSFYDRYKRTSSNNSNDSKFLEKNFLKSN